MKCPTCASKFQLTLGNIEPHSNRLCLMCRNLFHIPQNPNAPDHDSNFTAQRYSDILNLVDEEQNYLHIIETIKSLLPASTGTLTLHDFGCGTGNFMKVAQDHGFEVTGNDIWSEMIDIVRKKELTGYLGEFDAEMHSNLSVITFLCVIAHLDNPWMAIQKTSKSISKDGIIYLHTPRLCMIDFVAICLFFLTFKKSSRLLYRRININHRIIYSERALRIAAKEAGFEILAIEKTRGYGLKLSAYFTSLGMAPKLAEIMESLFLFTHLNKLLPQNRWLVFLRIKNF